MGWIPQLPGAGRGDESPAADAAYRDPKVADANKEAARARVERLAHEQTGEGN